MTPLTHWFMAIAFNLEPGMIYERRLMYEHHGIWGDNWCTGQLTPAAAHAFHARDAPQSKLSFRQLRQHGTESSSLPAAAVSSRKRRWTSAWGRAQNWLPHALIYSSHVDDLERIELPMRFTSFLYRVELDFIREIRSDTLVAPMS